MSRFRLFLTAILSAALFSAAVSPAQNLAPTPPMGWNSWDAYGLTITGAQFKANAKVLASVRQYGWQYAVIDEGWYMADPAGKTMPEKKYLWNKYGLLIPVSDRFPSAANGAGFKPLADWVHAQGLKFGIHIVRGIPRQVVAANLPIEGTNFHAADAADKTSPCPWDQGNWGVKDNAAGQAYYDSMFKLYASWGVDFVKVDCISDHPYRPTEIRQIAEAIRKTGRPIVLSLSPGPTALEHAAEVAKYAQMWRITNDHWDVWAPQHKPGQGEFPFGLKGEFDRIAEWAPYAGPGHWPDPDMLPWGWLGPHPGLGKPRQSRETHDEQRTEFTLWSMSRSPLILGANLTRLDPFTRSLITNREVLGINQKSTASGPAQIPAGVPWRAWWARTAGPKPATYLAVFNLRDQAAAWNVPWTDFHLSGAKHAVYDVWNRKNVPPAAALHVNLPAHGCALFRVE
jgi:hypothetical protein